MTEQNNPSHAAEPEAPPTAMTFGLIVFAGTMMVISGAFEAMSGLVALFEDEFYVSTPKYFLEFDATTWGWIHLLLGLLVVSAGCAVFAGQAWGRIVGIVLAALSALANFAFVPYYPFWSMLVITLDILVIWALTAHGRDLYR
jgi:hypothetical protein